MQDLMRMSDDEQSEDDNDFLFATEMICETALVEADRLMQATEAELANMQ